MIRRLAWGAVGLAGALLALFLAALYVRARRSDLPLSVIERLYPLPHQVLLAGREIPLRDVLSNVWASTERVTFGFLAAVALALPLGMLIGRSRTAEAALEPVNDFLRYLPVAGFSTIAISLLGTGNGSAVLVVFLGTAFHLVVAVADAARRVPPLYLDLARSLGLSPYARLRRVIVPAVAPTVFDALRVGLGWAWSYVTLAEVMGIEGGMGYAIEVSRRYVRTDMVFFWMLLIAVLGLAIDQGLRAVSRRAFRWAT